MEVALVGHQTQDMVVWDLVDQELLCLIVLHHQILEMMGLIEVVEVEEDHNPVVILLLVVLVTMLMVMVVQVDLMKELLALHMMVGVFKVMDMLVFHIRVKHQLILQ